MRLLRKVALTGFAVLAIAGIAYAATFDFAAPPLGSSEAEKRNDLNLELAGIQGKVTQSLCLALSDETTAITTGTAKVTWRMPFAFTLSTAPGGARLSVNTVSSSGLPTVDVKEGGTTIFGANKLSIDASEKTSTTAATAYSSSDNSLADDAEMTADVTVAGTGAKGLKLCLIGQRT
jgi:hypothetical protein